MEVLAFDCGEDIVGVLDVKTGEYVPYRGGRMIEGARRIVDCAGEVVTYNGLFGRRRPLRELLVPLQRVPLCH